MADPNYKRSMAVSLNGMPIETGAWTRRPGLRFLGLTRHGAPAKLFAFDFSTTQPYQIELTDGFLRMWAGTTLVMADTPTGYVVLNVTTDNPAKVAVSQMPATWANGDTVFFFINSEPCSAPALCNRQFTIEDVDTTTNTFTLRDPVTGANVDGATIAWAAPLPGSKVDMVAKVFELATPYTGTQYEDVRVSHNDTQVTMFHKSYAPRTLSTSVAEPFALTTQAFSDGPYLDPNTTTTTLTPSGATGSITVTASATTGINGGAGFKTTDVGRSIRFQSAPPAWAGGTLYAKAEVVTGSDGNEYSAVNSSLAADPTTDDGSHWLLVGVTPTWVWLKITAWTSTTVVTATVMGAATNPLQSPFILPNTLPSLTAQTAWQLGFFSDTDGWPTLAVYHGGRLWLANAITANRFDGSVSDDYFDFCPTAADGTVSDGNAIVAVLNADEVNAVFWMQSLPAGLAIGTQGSEWNIAASQLNDPITPTSIQAYRMSNFGSADIEAIKPWNRVLFTQRHNRKLLALRQAGEQGFDADNVSHLADQITAQGIAEIRWQQEPTLTVWMRRLDGTLAGCVYRSSAYSWSYGQSQAVTDSNFNGFFPVTHAYARAFTSISTGPSYDGLSSALYAVTNQTDNAKPDYNVHHVEYLMPMFDNSVKDWGSFFVDGGASPCCARKFLISNGDSFNGVRLYGLTYLNGLSTSVVIGGLDIGDFAVANGYVDVPFGTPATFTEAFFNSYDDGTAYGIFQTDVSYVTATGTTAPPHVAGSIGSYVNAAETHGNFAFSDLDRTRGLVYGFNTQDGNLDIFNYTTFALTKTISEATLLNGHTFVAADFCSHRDGFLYFAVDGGNHNPFGKFDPNQVYSPTIYGSTSSSTDPSGSDPGDGYALRATRQILPLVAGLFGYIAHVGLTSISSEQEVCLLNTTDMLFANGSVFTILEDFASLCIGPYSEDDNFASFYILGRYNSVDYTSGKAVGIYRCTFAGGGLVDSTAVRETWYGQYVPLLKLAPADIDPTWTTFGQVRTPVSCSDGNLILSATCTDSVTNTSYLFKLNPDTKEILWKVAGLDFGDPSPVARKTPFYQAIGHLTDSGGTPTFHYVNVATGAVTNFAFNNILDQHGNDFFDEIDGGLVMFDPAWAWVSNPTFLGAWSIAYGATGSSAKLSKLYFGLAASGGSGSPAPYTSRQYKVPVSTGLTYTSRGQLLRPDFGPDAGTVAGPAFGKKRRIHWYGVSVERSQFFQISAKFTGMDDVAMVSEDENATAAPSLFTGIISSTLECDYDFDGQIAWEVTRPTPLTVTAISGYIAGQDK